MTAESLGIFAVTLLLVAIYPGALVVVVISRVLQSGWRNVLPLLAAMWLGEAVWLATAVLGLAAIATRFATLFVFIKYAGIAYLAWLAWGMWRRPEQVQPMDLPNTDAPMRLFATGLALSLGSPEIMVFYIALLPSILDISGIDAGGLAALLGVMLTVLAAVDLSWVLLASRLRRLLRTPRLVRLTNRTSAGLMAGAAVFLAIRS